MSDEHTKKIFVGCDHAGFQLKKLLFASLSKEFTDYEWEDCGTHSEESVDYPSYAKVVAEKVVKTGGLGILVCGSGTGVSISANKIHGIRAANCWDVTSARLSREHNNTNIVCFGSRLVGPEVALEAARTWIRTPFAGGRHAKRVDLIHQLEG